MLSITAALVTAAVLGLLFSQTRWLAITAWAALGFVYPIPVLALLLIGVGVFLYLKYRKRS